MKKILYFISALLPIVGFAQNVLTTAPNSKNNIVSYTLYRGGPAIQFQSHTNNPSDEMANYVADKASAFASGCGALDGYTKINDPNNSNRCYVARFFGIESSNASMVSISTSTHVYKHIVRLISPTLTIDQTIQWKNNLSINTGTVGNFDIWETVTYYNAYRTNIMTTTSLGVNGPPFDAYWQSCSVNQIGKKVPVKVIDPIEWKNQGQIAVQCRSASKFDLRSFINDSENVTFSGNGIQDQIFFNPALVTSGSTTITAQKSYDNGKVTISLNITIIDSPLVTAGTNIEVCKDYGNIILNTGNPLGGEWSGNYINNNQFETSKAPAGEYTLSYTYTNNNGCSNTATRKITVNALPTVNAGSNVSMCYADAPLALSTVGKWSGQGIFENTFRPDLITVPMGSSTDVTHTLTIIDTKGCSNSAIRIVTVKANPTIIPFTSRSICKNAADLKLDFAVPTGGTWSGNGVSGGNTFKPTLVSTAQETLTYTLTTNGCTSSATMGITINSVPVITFGKNPIQACPEANSVNLLNSAPQPYNEARSSFFSNQVVGSTFNVQTAGVGSHIVQYMYTDEKGCSNTQNLTVQVQPVTTVSAGPNIEICTSTTPLVLSGNFPSGGSWTGSNVTSGTISYFTPSVPGDYTVTYTVNLSNNCSGFATKNIKVKSLPFVQAGSSINVCLNSTPVTLTGGVPSGGIWVGEGVDNDKFNPKQFSAAGLRDVEYRYTDPNSGCTNSAIKKININEAPIFVMPNDISMCVNDQAITLNIITAPGGIWEGKGVNGTLFSPSLAGAGSHKITYTVTNQWGCSNTGSRIMYVNSIPEITLDNNLNLCKNQGVINLFAEPKGGIWSGSAGINGNTFDPLFETNSNFILKYTFTDGNNCTNFKNLQTKIFSKPTVTTSATANKACINNDAITLTGGSPSGGRWIGSGVVSDSKLIPIVVGVGEHEIGYIYTNSNNCTDTSFTVVNVYNKPTVKAGLDSAMCFGKPNFSLNTYPNSSPSGGKWTGQNVNDNNLLLSSTLEKGIYKYIYTYTDGNKCISNDSMYITINPVPTKPSITGNGTVCYNDSVKLAASVQNEDVGTRFNWYQQNVDTIQYKGKEYTFVGLTNRTLFVEATNEFNCTSAREIKSITVQNPYGTLTSLNDTIDFGGLAKFQFSGSSDNNFLWKFSDGSESIEKNPAMYFFKEGNITGVLEITNTLGCNNTVTISKPVFVRTKKLNTVTDQPFTGNTSFANTLFKLYPNPVESTLVMEVVNSSETLQYTILNASGIEIERGSVSSGQKEINMDQLQSGMYLIRVTGSSVNEIVKISKK